MKLSPLFGDKMVLQRERENLIWGYDTPDTQITISFIEHRITTNTDAKGYFQTLLPSAKAGGPYLLEIVGKERIVISDVLIGDVFLLGGQSNMELPISRTLDLFREEMKQTEESMIRLFEVPKEYLFGDKREELEGGRWIQAAKEELMTFSAVGFFTAKELRKTESIPIGFLQTAVGGTPAKAWCSEESLEEAGFCLEELKRCKEELYVRGTNTYEAEREATWIMEAKKGFYEPEGTQETIMIPGLFTQGELADFHGSMILSKEITLTQRQSEEKAVIVFGAVVDADCIYINGISVGETGYRYPPRRYEIPKGVLKAGVNSIRIDMMVFRGDGGLIPGKHYGLEWEENTNFNVSLEGEWNYQVGRHMEELPQTHFFQYMASGLYQGMLVPIRKYGIKAFLYYQGESDTDSPEGYQKQMQCVIRDWRALWGEENLPFVYVQLPGYTDMTKRKQGENWAILREEQRKVLDTTSHTAMVVIHDVGEYNDLHPQDKQTVGKRLALAIRGIVYQENIEYSGPLYEWMEPKEQGICLHFTHTGFGLCAAQDTGFEVCGEDGKFVPAHVRIDKESVFVWSEAVESPQGVRYGFRNDPRDACLQNQEGLLASAFCSELVSKTIGRK